MTILFWYGCARKGRRSREMSSLEKRMWNYNTAQEQEAYRDTIPRRRTANPNGALFWSSRSTSWTSVIWRTAWTVDFFLHKHKVLKLARNVVGVLVHRLGGYGNSGDSCTPPMLSSPTLPSCTSQPESPVSLAPCTTCGSRGASKKKVLVHGLMQRAPRLVGSSRVRFVSVGMWLNV